MAKSVTTTTVKSSGSSYSESTILENSVPASTCQTVAYPYGVGMSGGIVCGSYVNVAWRLRERKDGNLRRLSTIGLRWGKSVC